MPVQPNEVPVLADAIDKANSEAPLRPNEIAKKRLEEVVRRAVVLVQRDKEKILEILRAESAKIIEECRNGTRPRHSFLPTLPEIFAKKMWDAWTEEERVDIEVFEGYCFVGRHQWFVVSGDPEEVEEPNWEFVIDPIPNGLLVFGKDTLSSATVLVIPPLSLWAKNYLGAPEAMMRAADQREQVQSKIS